MDMARRLERRHSRWYEQVIFSPAVQLLIGYALVVLLPSYLVWGRQLLVGFQYSVQMNTLLANSFAFFVIFGVLHKFKLFPGVQSLRVVLPTITMAWLLAFAVILFLRESAFSRPALLLSLSAATLWAYAGHVIFRRYAQRKYAIIPLGRAQRLMELPRSSCNVQLCWLDTPDLSGRRFDAVIADLHSGDLSPEWQRFLAECTLAKIPVYHYQQIVESVTGRIPVEHLSENAFGNLQPSPVYSLIKRLIESALVLASLPVWLPVMLITGILIKLESEGPMFFIQERVGQGNRDFKVYKLRSMCRDSEKDGAQFAKANDMRVTKVGKIIRKTRIDELPQFFNVLKGDMSLIGPRPEQRIFVNQFEKEIPFYSYRHVVKPGITGWAQVIQGYTADAEDSKIKLQYDLYYIKHFSLWLDVLILFKTIKTILTGFGAR